MQIDPRATFWLGVWTSILMCVVTGTISFTGLVPEAYVPVIVKWCANFAIINNILMTALTGVSSNKVGPFVSPPPPAPASPSTSSVAKLILIAFLPLAALAMVTAGSAPAQAQGKPLKAATCLIPLDPLKLCGALTGNPVTDMQRVVARIQAAAKADLTYAIAKATAANTPASKIRLQCLVAIAAANDQLNGASIKDASGAVIPRPDPAVITGLEDIAELVDNLSPQGALLTSCAGAAELFKTNALAAVNGIVTGAAGLATASATGL